jgi:ATP-binding cassette subfamily C protein CydC
LQISSQEPIIREPGSLVGRQPSAVSVQPSAVGRQSSAVGGQSSAVGSHPSAVGSQLSAVGGEQSEAGFSSLQVRSLSFTYPGETRPALQDVSFELYPGQRIAITGPSGAGKTTLLHLLLRFWDYSSGEILLDGLELRQYAPAEVRQRMAVVSQQAYLFNTTLEENLRLANPQAASEQLDWALRQAQLHDFVHTLPAGLATPLGEHGLRLSTGQRQRLAIARALLRPGSILLLDEPAAGLDTVTERELMDTLNKLPGQAVSRRSILLVTHSLVGLEDFDQVLVLQAGQVVERGAPAARQASGGWYTRHYGEV